MKRTLLVLCLVGLTAAAGEPAAGTIKDGKVVKSARDEIARLQRELDEQRALLIRILEVQEQQYAMLVKLAKGEISASQLSLPDVAPRTVSAPPPVAAPEPVVTTPAPERTKTTASPKASAAKTQTAAITGSVALKGGGQAWVFVEDLKGSSSGELEIKQQDKQFSPRIAAVPRGTKLVFANYDSIFHNVFSTSGGNAFDLGNTRSGEPPRAYSPGQSGVIEIFCNMHSKMSASVLVAPGPHLVRVEADGSFKLDDIPVGNHRVSAWAGGQRVVTKDVEVSASGGEVSFELQAGDSGPHKKKDGQSYGSYAD